MTEILTPQSTQMRTDWFRAILQDHVEPGDWALLFCNEDASIMKMCAKGITASFSRHGQDGRISIEEDGHTFSGNSAKEAWAKRPSSIVGIAQLVSEESAPESTKRQDVLAPERALKLEQSAHNRTKRALATLIRIHNATISAITAEGPEDNE